METLLTGAEHAVIRQAGDLYTAACAVVGDGPTRDADLAELIAHVHAIQHTVMAQAASRAYPEEYRLLGGMVEPPKSYAEEVLADHPEAHYRLGLADQPPAEHQGALRVLVDDRPVTTYQGKRRREDPAMGVVDGRCHSNNGELRCLLPSLHDGDHDYGESPYDAVEALANALRLTREYVGAEVLPAIPGWSWYDALSRYAPDCLPPEPSATDPHRFHGGRHEHVGEDKGWVVCLDPTHDRAGVPAAHPAKTVPDPTMCNDCVLPLIDSPLEGCGDAKHHRLHDPWAEGTGLGYDVRALRTGLESLRDRLSDVDAIPWATLTQRILDGKGVQ